MTDETKGGKPAKGPFDSDGERSTGVARGLTNYGDTGFSLFLRKAFIKGAGLSDDALARPIIGIVNTGSSYNPCPVSYTHLPRRADSRHGCRGGPRGPACGWSSRR